MEIVLLKLRDQSLFIDRGRWRIVAGSLDFRVRERGDHSVMMRRNGGGDEI